MYYTILLSNGYPDDISKWKFHKLQLDENDNEEQTRTKINKFREKFFKGLYK